MLPCRGQDFNFLVNKPNDLNSDDLYYLFLILELKKKNFVPWNPFDSLSRLWNPSKNRVFKNKIHRITKEIIILKYGYQMIYF